MHTTGSPRTRPYRRAALATAALLPAALLVPTGPAASAAAGPADHGHVASAWGTRVVTEAGGFKSGRTAHSMISCTTRTGVTRRRPPSTVVLPDGAGRLTGVTSATRTVRHPGRSATGVISTSRVGRLRLVGTERPDGDVPTLSIDALTSVAKVARRAGDRGFTTGVRYTSGPISLDGVSTPLPGSPLADLLDGVGRGITGVLDVLDEHGSIEVPGLATIERGSTTTWRGRGRAVADGTVLRVVMESGGTELQVGRANAKMFARLPAGPMAGEGAAVRVLGEGGPLPLDLSVGTLVKRTLPCPGTNGRVSRTRERSLDTPALSFDSARSASFGVQRATGVGRAWTRSRLEQVTLGDPGGLRITEVVARATVRRLPDGRLVTRSRGTSLGTLFLGGRKVGSLEPGETYRSKDGRFRVTAGLVRRTKRAITVVGARVTVTDDTGNQAVVLLGRTRANIRNR